VRRFLAYAGATLIPFVIGGAVAIAIVGNRWRGTCDVVYVLDVVPPAVWLIVTATTVAAVVLWRRTLRLAGWSLGWGGFAMLFVVVALGGAAKVVCGIG
jgi:hypothetical protein